MNATQPQATQPGDPSAAPKKELSLFDSTCLIVGIIIGAGIYQTAPDVAKGAGGAVGLLALWTVGGLLSLCGALCYAELASTYPRNGGDYVYLGRAYGRWAGFMFGWIQLAIVRPGDIAVMAFAFATYFRTIYDPFSGSAFPYGRQIYAMAAVVLLTLVNIWGVRQGKWTQNLLTSAKVLGLLAIVLVAAIAPRAAGETVDFDPMPLSIALILVLFTFGGWNEMAYVAAEVKNPRRNIIRALVLGTVAVTAIYLLANAAFLYALGYKGMATSDAVATDTISTLFPHTGGRLISLLVCISALGAVNGLVFAGARITYAVGLENRPFRALGHWDRRTGTPVRALILQAAIAVALIVILGSFVNTILYTAAAVYTFYFATCLAVIVLRAKDAHRDRPYRVTGYPLTTLLFCCVCLFLVYSAVTYKPQIAAVSCLLLLLGLPLFALTRERSAGGKDRVA
jgi:APA family basic amino acid/polyamine antiporter